jgi:sugar/nucleoside kinase (ribokinase family)
MDTQFDIIVSGHLCLDLIPEMAGVTMDAMTVPGHLVETGPISISTGGAVSNTGLALHRLGVKVGLMATAGDDLLGQSISAFLRQRDPQLSQLITIQPAQASSYSVVLSPQQSDRIFLHCTGTNSTFGAEYINFAHVGTAQIFHLGYPPLLPRLIENDGAELALIYQKVKAAGVVTSLDMALPDPNGPSGQANWPAILRNTLPHVDVFLPSIEEILFMLRRSDYDQWEGEVLAHLNRAYLAGLADELLAMGAQIIGFKLGEMGIYLRTASHLNRFERLKINLDEWAGVEVWIPAFQTEVIGTTGAGDAAYAGFLAAMLRGYSPSDCLRWACAVGACNVEAADATSGIRTWAETQARLDTGWPALATHLPGYPTENSK